MCALGGMQTASHRLQALLAMVCEACKHSASETVRMKSALVMSAAGEALNFGQQ